MLPTSSSYERHAQLCLTQLIAWSAKFVVLLEPSDTHLTKAFKHDNKLMFTAPRDHGEQELSGQEPRAPLISDDHLPRASNSKGFLKSEPKSKGHHEDCKGMRPMQDCQAQVYFRARDVVPTMRETRETLFAIRHTSRVTKIVLSQLLNLGS